MDYIEEDTYKGRTQLLIFKTKMPTEEGQLAVDLLRHLAIVAGDVDGEDSSGRSKLRLLEPKEVAARAVAIAEAAWAAFEDKGWVLPLPAPKPQELKHRTSRT